MAKKLRCCGFGRHEWIGCDVGQADWSPKGFNFVAYRYGKPRTGLWIMNVDGSHRRLLTSGRNPDWQPLPAS